MCFRFAHVVFTVSAGRISGGARRLLLFSSDSDVSSASVALRLPPAPSAVCSRFEFAPAVAAAEVGRSHCQVLSVSSPPKLAPVQFYVAFLKTLTFPHYTNVCVPSLSWQTVVALGDLLYETKMQHEKAVTVFSLQ